MKTKVVVCTVLVAMLTVGSLTSLQAQDHITYKETVEYLDKKLRKVCAIKVKKSVLFVEFSKGGSVYREDKVFLEDIHPDQIYYSKEEQGTVLRCHQDECITRKLKSRGIIRGYDRIVFKVDQAEGEALAKAFTHLVNILLDDNYKNATPFE